jgi:hypothetical protein
MGTKGSYSSFSKLTYLNKLKGIMNTFFNQQINKSTSQQINKSTNQQINK